MGKLLPSNPELVADALQRVLKRGRANLRETALILGRCTPTIRAQVDRGEIVTMKVGKLRYIPLDELARLRGQGQNVRT